MVTANQEREKQVAVERIVGFAEEFGEEHLILACHGAFPLMLTPDLLYQIWANFVPEAPWTAVARVLLSRLCKQVGYESYEMNLEVRNLLLKELKESQGKERLEELGAFLLEYVQQRLIEDDPDTQNLREAQEWTALAYTKPDEAARELAEALSEKAKQEDIGEVLRLSSLVETLAEPLLESGFKPLLVYSNRIVEDIKDAYITDFQQEQSPQKLVPEKNIEQEILNPKVENRFGGFTKNILSFLMTQVNLGNIKNLANFLVHRFQDKSIKIKMTIGNEEITLEAHNQKELEHLMTLVEKMRKDIKG